MINTKKVELINGTAGCLSNSFSVKNFCLPTE